MAPSCNLYLSEEDKKIYQDLKKQGENPSALFSKAMRQRAAELDEKSAQMTSISILKGFESHYESIKQFELFKFVGKLIASGNVTPDDPVATDFISITQALYETRKGKMLLYEVVEAVGGRECRYRIIEKNKPLPAPLADEVLKALGVQDEIGTFLDI